MLLSVRKGRQHSCWPCACLGPVLETKVLVAAQRIICTGAHSSLKIELRPDHDRQRYLTDIASCVMQNERVLFHYNGHGVPRPTANGEIWVFNKSYTQYIPMSVYDLQAWVGSPAIYVFDCSAAGLIINSFRAFAEQRTQVRPASAAPAGDGVLRVFPETWPISYQRSRQQHCRGIWGLSVITALRRKQNSLAAAMLAAPAARRTTS